MPVQIYVKPKKEGLIIRQPHRNQEPVPAHGATVPKNAFWLRRLRDGDVVSISQEEFEKAEAAIRKKAEAEAKAKQQAEVQAAATSDKAE